LIKKNMEYKHGEISWTDLTITNAEEVKDFYTKVMGWTATPISMGDYNDYVLMNGDKPVGGVCHARGSNTGLPTQWLQYVAVDDVQQCIAACNEAGGKVIHGPRKVDRRDFCVLQDPAGAVMAIIAAKRDDA